MHTKQAQVIEQCVQDSRAARITFPQVIARLSEAGVERYHADYSRGETTYYLPSGESLVVATAHPAQPTGQEFLHNEVEAAIRRSQRNEHTYADFVRETMAAGCVGYFVHIMGRCVIYMGRCGEAHREPFPTAPKN